MRNRPASSALINKSLKSGILLWWFERTFKCWVAVPEIITGKKQAVGFYRDVNCVVVTGIDLNVNRFEV